MQNKDILSIKTLDELYNYKKKVNEDFDKREKFIKDCMKLNELSNDSFYAIKESFEYIAPKLFKTKEGQNILRKYQQTVSNSSNLSSLYSLYESIRKANKNTDIEFFVNSICNENWIVDKKETQNDLEKLGKILSEGCLMVGEIPEMKKENKQLVASIKFLVENKKNKKNIAEYSDAVKILKEHILKQEGSLNINESVNNIDNYVETLISNFNSKYSSEDLSSSEMKMIGTILASSKQDELFEEHKNKCISKLNEVKTSFDSNGDKESANKITNIIEQINQKTYNKKNICEDILSFNKLSQIFDESNY